MKLKLTSLLKEVETSKYTTKNSYESFYWSYYYLVRCRRMIERSIVQGKMELDRKVKELQYKIDNRVKDEEGGQVSPLDIDNLKNSHYLWNRRQIGFLKQVQDLESTWMDLHSSRGVDMFSEEDIEEKTFFSMRDQTSTGTEEEEELE